MNRNDDRRAGLEERLRFFEEIGAGFLSLSPTGRPAKCGSRASRTLEEINAEILICRKCPLASGRTQAVPGEGNPEAELMFVGEGPGHDEDVQGRPFVGRAGQLLTRIINKMGLDRPAVYIANIVKCRPPENRLPLLAEVEACTPYLLEQIAAIQPKVIVTLGKTATDFFAPSRESMTDRRGRFEEWRGIAVMPTFHPSYLVRNEGNKELKWMVWEDMQKVLGKLAER